MSIIEKLFGEKKTITKPIFIKEFTKENRQLRELEALRDRLNDGDKKDRVIRDISFIKYGIDGENNVYYELKNSFIPMICLHNIRLQHEEYIAQLDFVVVTSKYIAILETKKLSGNIDKEGNFTRIHKDKYGKDIKEGMYSPLVQNNRHLNIVKEVLRNKLGIHNVPIISMVVMANEASVINKTYCPMEIRKQICKHDQLNTQLQWQLDNGTKEEYLNEKQMYKIANLLLENNVQISYDNEKKYGIKENNVEAIKTATKVRQNSANNREKLTQKLKEYRKVKASEQNVPPYIIFTDAQMEILIDKNPRDSVELKETKIFGDARLNKYGADIIDILNSAEE